MSTSSYHSLGRITPLVRVVSVLVLVGAAALLVAGIYGGLTRLGIGVGPSSDALVHYHGPLMVSAFFGAVISTERAVAVRRTWSFIGPVAAVVGGLSLVVFATPIVSAVFFTVAGLSLLGVFGYLLRRRFESFTAAMALGALAWAVGNILWTLGEPVAEVVPWWAAFLVLTIAGERLELSRMRASNQHRAPFWLGFGLTFAGLLASLLVFDAGSRVVGAGFVVLALWLARNDVARATIRTAGPPRFMAIALFAGYFWLAAAGALAVFFGGVHAGWIYDAIWHAVFVGFVFSMVFAHAQVILPALSGVRVDHGPKFYAPLMLLHLATGLRVAGDLAASEMLRRAGGIGNALAIGLFVVVLASSVRRRSRRQSVNRA